MLKKNFSKIKYNNKYNKGQALIVSLVFFTALSASLIVGLVSPTVSEYKLADTGLKAKKSFYLSESGVEDAYYRINSGKTIGSTETIDIDGYIASTNIVDAGNQKTITSAGDVGNRDRSNEIILEAGTGIAFSYGVQSGQGGFTMSNGSSVIGSVYSNGNITGSGTITGSAISANSSSLTADQTNDSGTPAYDVQFGNANATQDFAQSFQVSTTDIVNKVELYLKKVSNPSDITVRIVSDNAGVPSSTELASGSLSASLVSTSYGWVSVPFSTNPQLTASTTYWIVVDASTSSSKYYYIGANSNGYASGTGKIGRYTVSWSDTTPVGLDGFFKLYLGGLTGLISGITVGQGGVGSAYAHTVNDSTIADTNYCQTGSGNNKACDTSLADPVQIAMPISEQNILDWKDEALVGGTYTGNMTIDGTTTSIGPKKIVGNLTIQNNSDVTITGTLWVTGNIIFDNNVDTRLSASYGSSEGAIIVDGTVSINNNADFHGSGTAGSYIMVLSTSTSTSAITLGNNAGAVVLYAANGTVDVQNNAGATSINGYKINLSNNAVITFDSGLINANFVSGPSGGWNVNSWKETE